MWGWWGPGFNASTDRLKVAVSRSAKNFFGLFLDETTAADGSHHDDSTPTSPSSVYHPPFVTIPENGAQGISGVEALCGDERSASEGYVAPRSDPRFW